MFFVVCAGASVLEGAPGGAPPDRVGVVVNLVRGIVNSLRALYRFAQDRELADHDPAQHVRLPASTAKPRDRVATPAEFARLIAALYETTPKERKERKSRDPREA